ncbi:MAG: GNAT family N-acetyltransferase [Caldilineaceae bacterium]|nr:GNAT family N-acetyltransferase [Caldilineaceae bacterium]MBP8109777.1 GNAT family N-acetyltransferase [Caldilineaceae bacterium]MBP8125406.1 GNAT family N-acetyltransferase [Caldilineaceae bacterium]MBP9074804.1 GNAT family N-acetyltransferase [Caldilineaceae bacterium]
MQDVHQKVIPIHMIRPTLAAIPQFDLPPGVGVRTFRPGDEAIWAHIQDTADLYNHVTVEIHRRDYGTDEEVLAQRQFFLMDKEGTPFASASAWWQENYVEAGGGAWGEVHWVAMLPAWQGRGVARPLMTLVLNRMAELGHTRAYLNTATPRLAAVNLYLRFGFLPHLYDDATTGEQRRIWQALTPHLRYPTGLDA